MVKGKYEQLCLYAQFGGINTIGFIQTLQGIKKIVEYEIKCILFVAI